MVYGMAWWAWHGIWYGLVGITGHGLARHSMVYGMAWLYGMAWHGIVYCKAWRIWYGMLYDMVWQA